MRSKLPIPTKNNPYVQLDFMFNKVAGTKTNKSTKSKYLTALNYYKKFLNATANYNEDLRTNGLFYIDQHWNEFALVNLKTYIIEANKKGKPDYLTSNSIVGIFSAVRIVVKEAIINGYTSFDNLIDASIGRAGKETNGNSAYSEREMQQIEKAVKEELKFVYKVLNKEGYKYTGIGNDPRIKGNYWGNVDNMRWYFENVLNCEPVIGTSENKQLHKTYVEYAPTKYYQSMGGLRGIYRKWGVTAFIDADIIMPLVMRLAIQTGLNVDSLLNLKVDCFEDRNPISGVPVIKYFKARSGGEKEMHLNTHEQEELKEFRTEQAKVIANTIKVVLALTAKIREQASSEIQDKLFIMQTASKRKIGSIIQVNDRVTFTWRKSFVKKYGLKNDNGEILELNLRRFRSTRATNLVEKGVEIFELQHEMGHERIETTMQYVEKNNLDAKARKETDEVLSTIYSNKIWAEDNKVNYNHEVKDDLTKNVIYKGFLCDCKNPFNPPEEVKMLKDYEEGSACSRINMCLFCDNVVIFKRNLPSLWMYKKQIDVAMATQHLELPNERFYLKTLDIINALFDENESEFSAEDLEEAKRIAENLDELIDPVTYRSVKE